MKRTINSITKAEQHVIEIHNMTSHTEGGDSSFEFVTGGGWVPENAKISVIYYLHGPQPANKIYTKEN